MVCVAFAVGDVVVAVAVVVAAHPRAATVRATPEPPLPSMPRGGAKTAPP